MNRQIVYFLIGAAVGGIGTYLYMDYKNRNTFSREQLEAEKENPMTDSNEKEAFTKDKPEIKQVYEKLVKDYSGISKQKEKENKDEKVDKTALLIPPEDFGENEDYEQISLYYTEDAVLIDDSNEAVENPDDLVGKDFASHFGDFEDDAIYFRNDKYKTYYEVLRSLKKYSEIREAYGLDKRYDPNGSDESENMNEEEMNEE